ncbi:hypothetical protein VTL71DRAFT_10835 [Oculimacula yallundae]|uniref:Required for respiratory growth protein 9, mitochondrial n=1 Tax=Oculimacula yallundae TaxID=86028 RepID=A0ABR4CU71_9HELO
MTCRCTANTLSLFIRNVAQVDVSSSTKHAIRQAQRCATQKSPSRGFVGTLLSSRAYSSATLPESDSTETRPKKHVDAPIVDFSLDAIDSILEESPWATSAKDTEAERESRYETPLQSLLKDIPRKKPRAEWSQTRSENAKTFTSGDVPRTLIRRTTANSPLVIKFDNPPAFVRKKEADKADGRSRSRPQDDWVPPPRDPWMAEKNAVKEKYPEGYKPMKKLSPDAISGIRALHAQMPERYTTWALSQEFEVSPESIRRILKSKWRPDSEEETERQRRWFKRGESIWSRYAELGVKPPKKWREQGIGNGKPEWKLRKQMIQDDPLPALVTTARRKEQKSGQVEANLADKIL